MQKTENALRREARLAEEGQQIAQTAFEAFTVTEKMTSDAFSLDRRLATGTIVDATNLHAPSSTKKGKQWYFGMKAMGADRKTKLIHTAVVTPANVADAKMVPELLHGEETKVWGDQAYCGPSEVIQKCAPRAQDCTQRLSL
jgi:IS5 family transposase